MHVLVSVAVSVPAPVPVSVPMPGSVGGARKAWAVRAAAGEDWTSAARLRTRCGGTHAKDFHTDSEFDGPKALENLQFCARNAASGNGRREPTDAFPFPGMLGRGVTEA